MVTDIFIDEDRRTEYDETGDIRVVEGPTGITQAITIDVLENVGLAAPTPTPTRIERHRATVERVIRDNDFTQPPIDVRLDDISEQGEQLTYSIETNRVTVQASFGGEQ